MSAVSAPTSALADTRRKQSKKDEAIRRKIEAELARKRTISTTHQSSRGKKPGKIAATKGTVAALRPSPALTVPESISVSDASQLCAAKRTDCVLVVDDDEGLSGIFTAKDLAYRVTAEGLDPRNTPVSAIMTRNPMVTRDTTSATEALQLMVQKHFRHLPVCNEEGNVVGLLDITKVFHEALAKVERSSSASQKLYAALEGVQTEFGTGMGTNPQAAAMMAYVDSLRDKTALPDLTTIIDARTHPAMVSPKCTVQDAAKLMKQNRTTAVCVMEGSVPSAHAKIAGIFTSKDVVLRTIAAGLDPTRCSVVRVMTPHPDVVPPAMTVQDALKKMHNGHYLNLPVVEADGRLIAVVDVLKLTYATLEQMNALAAGDAEETEGGPLWGRFFDSIAANDDTESAISGSHMRSQSVATPPPHRHPPPVQDSPHSELFPGDSASAVDEVTPASLEHFPPLPSQARGVDESTMSAPNVTLSAPIPVDDGTYVFKFRTPSGRTHRFQARTDDAENLRDIIIGKLESDPFFSSLQENRPDPKEFHVAYTDLDGDTVVISSNEDVQDAVRLARQAHQDRVVLHVQGTKPWDVAKPDVIDSKLVEVEAATPVRKENSAGNLPEGVSYAPPARLHANLDDSVFGVPRDLILPASIAGLAAVIAGVFVVSRLARD